MSVLLLSFTVTLFMFREQNFASALSAPRANTYRQADLDHYGVFRIKRHTFYEYLPYWVTGGTRSH